MGRTEPLRVTLKNKLGGPAGIADNFVVPQPNNHPTLILQEGRPPTVVISGLLRVLSTVEFDCQSGFTAGEIDDVWADNQLPREPRSILSQTQPEQALRFR